MSLLVEPHVLRHFAIDPLVSPLYMAQVNANGLQVYAGTYFLTGDEFIIPCQDGMVVALLCHVPDAHHEVDPEECALLKHACDPWNVSVGVVLKNTDPYLSVVVPPRCDIYSLVHNLSVELVVVDDEEFFEHYLNR
jgi:hypothetical protein